jgi:hypothetical protein
MVGGIENEGESMPRTRRLRCLHLPAAHIAKPDYCTSPATVEAPRQCTITDCHSTPVALRCRCGRTNCLASPPHASVSHDRPLGGCRLRRLGLLFALEPKRRSIVPYNARNETRTYGRALRATRAIERDASLLKSLPELTDRETGVREVLEILKNIIAEAGDLVESRSPELIARARAALRRYADEAPRQAE